MAEKKLTNRKIDAECGPARLSDGNGLYLVVRRPAVGKKSGSKAWSYVWIRQGRRRELGLGGYPALSLKNARITAEGIRTQIAQGLDPKAERDKKSPVTFGEAAELVLIDLSKAWKHPKHGAQWVRALTVLAKPIRQIRVAEITTADVLRVVKPVYDKTPETGRRLRSRIERVLEYATAHGMRSGDNPARLNDHFKILLGSKKQVAPKHYAAMPYADVPEFFKRLRSNSSTAAQALAFTILTAARTNETLGAKWEEFNLERRLWTIPAERMKAGAEHIVPLTGFVVSILEPLNEVKLSEYVFPGQKPRNPLSNMTMAMTMRRMGVGKDLATVHGFRSSFRDWAGDCTNAPREVAEGALAHIVGNAVEKAYRRGIALEKRRRLMTQWTNFCLGQKSAGIVRIYG